MLFLFWSMTEEEITARIKKIGATKKSDLIDIGAGFYIHKNSEEAFLEMCKRHNTELSEFLADDDNLFNAIRYEMYQHEYAYAEDDEQDNILDALHLGRDILVKDERIRNIWEKAADRVCGRI